MRFVLLATIFFSFVGLALINTPTLAADNLAVLGERIATEAACANCHGKNGRAGLPQIPNLAGQHAPYLEKQLKELRAAGRTKDRTFMVRHSPVMEGMSQGLSDNEIMAVATYFSGLSCRGEGVVTTAPAEVKICAECHGTSGRGESEKVIPVLAAQKWQYLLRQLKFFRGGTGTSGHFAQGWRNHPTMSEIAQGLSDEVMTGLAVYYSKLPCGK